MIWKRLRHPNVVPFIGVTSEPLQIVSEWMPNGTLTDYVEKNPDANRIDLVGLFLVTRLIDNVILPSYWMWQKVSTIFMQTLRYMET